MDIGIILSKRGASFLSLLIFLSLSSAFANIPGKKQMHGEKDRTHSALETTRNDKYAKGQASKDHQKVYQDYIKVAFDDSKDVMERWRAIIEAAKIGKKESLKDLVRAVDSPYWFLRNAALLAMQETDSSLAQRSAIKLLNDKALVIRSAAVDILSTQLYKKDIRSLLWKELEKPDNYRGGKSLWIRGQILKYLSSEPEIGELDVLAKYKEDKDIRVQGFALDGLEKLAIKKVNSR